MAEFSKNCSLEFEPKEVSGLSGSLELGMTFRFVYYISSSHSYITSNFEYELSASVAYSKESSIDPIRLLKIPLPLCTGVNAELELDFVIKANVNFQSALTISGNVGFSVDSIVGVQNLTGAPEVDFSQSLEGEIYVGLNLGASIKLLEVVGEVEMSGEVGFRAKGELSEPGAVHQRLIHLCDVCIEGKVNFEASISASASIARCEDLTFSKDLWDIEIPLFDFYNSITYDTFGLTKCPYVRSYVDVKVVNEDGYPVNGARVKFQETTDGYGKCSMFMDLGSQKITVVKDGYKTSEEYYTVTQNYNYFEITLYKEEEKTTEEETTEEETTEEKELLGDRDIVDIQRGIFFSEYPHERYLILTNDGKLWVKDGDGIDKTGLSTVSDAELLTENVKSFFLYGYAMGVVTKDNQLYYWGSTHVGYGINDRYDSFEANDVEYAQVGLHSGEKDNAYAYIDTNKRLHVNYLAYGEHTGYVMDDVVDMEYDDSCIYAVKSNGTLYGWGKLSYEQGNEPELSPKVLMDNVESISSYGGKIVAITKDKELYVLYEDSYKPIKIMDGVKECSVDGTGIYALLNTGVLYQIELLDNGYGFDSQKPYVLMTNVERICGGRVWSNEGFINGAIVVKKRDGSFAGIKNGAVYWTLDEKSISFFSLRTAEAAKEQQTDLQPEEVYNVYILKSLEGDDLLMYDNILYIGQYQTDKNGEMVFDYELREEYDNPEFLYVKMSKDDISNATVEVMDMTSTGEKQYVVVNVALGGKPLVEGKDFYLEGDDYFTNEGNYSVTVCGMGEYTGEVTVEYTVKSHIDVNNESVEINGLQMSSTLEGIRTAYSVEPVIDKMKVEECGLVNGLASYITEDDVYVGNENKYVASFSATSAGLMSAKVGTSDTANSYAMTMNCKISTISTEGLSAQYYVRAYAKLSDGSYVYSDVAEYSIYSVSQYLYDNKKMLTESSHEYLYDKILSRVDSNYAKVEFPLSNTLVES